MTTRTTATTAPAKRERTKAEKTAGRYLLALAAVLIPALVLRSLPLAVLGVLVVLGVAVFRLRKAVRRWRSGGKVAAKQRAKYQGHATWREIRAKLSPAAARKRAKATCPGLHPSEAHVVIGRTKGIIGPIGGHVIADTWSGARLVYAPPQSLKTALTSCWAVDIPGAALLFSSRCDQYDHTYLARKERGGVAVLNADGEGGIPTDFAWPPVDGCEVRQTAMRRAGDLMAATPHDPSGKDAHWDALSKKMLQYLLKAAALTPGGNIATVREWASSPAAATDATEILEQHDPEWGRIVSGMIASALFDEKYWSAISSGIDLALAWLDDDAMRAAACPAPGEGIDLRKFIEDGTGTVYIIGADREHGSLAPYFAAFGAEAFHVARSVAEAQPGRRLRRPFVIIADEAATIVPLPWHKITAVSSGYNIGITACFQADSQITARWGEHDAKTIRTNFTVKIIGPGFTDPGELADLSAMCGDRDTWDHADIDGGGLRPVRPEKLYPPERIQRMADWHALVLHRNARPVEVKVTPVWKRHGYERVQSAPAPVRLPVPQPAITPVPARVMVPAHMVRRIPVPILSRPAPRALPRRLAIGPPVPAITSKEHSHG